MVKEGERHLILEMIESGKISADEGLELLKALEPLDFIEESEQSTVLPPGAETMGENLIDTQTEVADATAAAGDERITGEVLDPVEVSLPPDAEDWRRWWRVPMWIGVGITTLAGLLMLWAQQANGIGFLFFCAWVPLLLGVFLIVLSWQSRTSRWLHLRIQQPPGEWPQKIAISFPIPMRMTSWFFRTFRGTIPGMDNLAVDELINALDQSTSPENPLYVEVEDDEDGERVEIYIG